MEITRSIKRVRELTNQAKGAGKVVGLVPTMGALHAGHMSLIEAARQQCGFVVVSVFVNPTQFGPGEDFENYPRRFEEDKAKCAGMGVDVLFLPSEDDMYGQGQKTWVNVEGLTKGLCGASREGHFRGVTTVCTKLFNIVRPDKVFFGQKDGQQAAVIERMVSDLNMEVKVVVCPTVREKDGLAMSSRNKYLSEDERADAICLYRGLCAGSEMVEGGERDAGKVLEKIREVLGGFEAVEIEYVNIVDTLDLNDVERIAGRVMIAGAVRIGSTRLIDNIVIEVS